MLGFVYTWANREFFFSPRGIPVLVCRILWISLGLLFVVFMCE